MSDAVQIPPRPDLDSYLRLARDLKAAVARDAVSDWATRWLTDLSKQVVIERFGDRSVPLDRMARGIERQWRRFVERQLSIKSALPSLQLTDAQLFVARIHGFASWPEFTQHIDAMMKVDSTPAIFERAVDAIVAGDIDMLGRLLSEHPDLARARSTREHHSTLLHYVSANGVEDFRQKTPPNIVSIAQALIDRGADVNAESEAYGGHSTTLGLTATSVHPEAAGVQIPLLELLLARGANIEQRGQAGNNHSAVVGCLANGQGRAARFLAERGATLDLEGAAGVGNIAALEKFVDEHGHLMNGATAEQFKSGFMYAAGYGREQAVGFLLARGADPNTATKDGVTALHWTTYGPHAKVARLLLDAGARADVRGGERQATPLDWALDHWVSGYDAEDRERGYELIEMFIRAGAKAELERFDQRTRSTLESDARLMEILRS